MAIPLKTFLGVIKKYYFLGAFLTKTFCIDVINMIMLI